MTSADALIEALLLDAHETAEKIIQDAKKTVQDTLEEQRNKGRERARADVILIEKKAQDELSIIKLRKIASTESKAKKLILEKKHKMIENVLEQVKNELRSLTKTDKYVHILENLIIEGGFIVGAKNLEVLLNEKDSTLQLDYNKMAEKVSENTGRKTKIKKSVKKIETIGGAIIQTTDEDKSKDFYEKNSSLKLITETNNFGNGKIVMNNTFEGILHNSEIEIRFKIAQILFT